MDGIPLKVMLAILQEVKEDFKVIVPDYESILQETEYQFSLENKVLTGLQNGFTSQHQPLLSSLSELLPTCPPYWMMFSSPQQSPLASCHSSSICEPSLHQHSYSLRPTVLCTNFLITDSDEKGGIAAFKAQTCVSGHSSRGHPAISRPSQQQKAQKTFIPDLLNPPACLSSLPYQRRKNLRQCSLSLLDTSTHHDPDAGCQAKSLSTHRAPNTRTSNTRTNIVQRLAVFSNHNTAHTMPVSPDLCRTSHPQVPAFSGSDLTADLLSALSPEERELLEAITARGYPLCTAIIALQKTGQQTPDQVLSYLVACDHLCQLGYDITQVEEALEMFHNCEIKAEEFLHLLSQFNEMGFQQNTIKEVLLVHENHQERALEELMMRVA